MFLNYLLSTPWQTHTERSISLQFLYCGPPESRYMSVKFKKKKKSKKLTFLPSLQITVGQRLMLLLAQVILALES